MSDRFASQFRINREVKGNAKVKHFVLEQRKVDLVYKLKLPTLAILIAGLVSLGSYHLYQSLKQEIIIKKEVVHTSSPHVEEPAKLNNISKGGPLIQIQELGLVIEAGQDIKLIKTLKNYKKKKDCESVNPSEVSGRNDFVVCSYTTANSYASSNPKLTLSYVYNKTNNKIYQYNIESTIPKYVKLLKASTSNLSKYKFKLLKKKNIEITPQTNTLQFTYINQDYDLVITSTEYTSDAKKEIAELLSNSKLSESSKLKLRNKTGNYKISINSRK